MVLEVSRVHTRVLLVGILAIQKHSSEKVFMLIIMTVAVTSTSTVYSTIHLSQCTVILYPVLETCRIAAIGNDLIGILLLRLTHIRTCVPTHAHTQLYTHIHTVLEIRSKCRMDKCPSIIILGQTFSYLLGDT